MGEFSMFHWLVVLLILLGPMLALYFLPSILARQKRQATAVFVLNLLLGWTVLGWIGALVWALVEPQPPTQVIVQTNVPAVTNAMTPMFAFCSSCGKQSDAGSKFCSGCGRPLAT
jgi:hypothetical protein